MKVMNTNKYKSRFIKTKQKIANAGYANRENRNYLMLKSALTNHRTGCYRQSPFDTAEKPCRNALRILKQPQFRQIVKYRIKHRHSQKGEQQAHRLTSDDQHADRT